MSRNNEERLGISGVKDADPPFVPEVMAEKEEQKESQNINQPASMPLSFSIPTEFVDLPSGGKFYGPDHPCHGRDSVEMRFMTAKEEDILTSRTLIKKGIVIDRLLQSLIVEKHLNIDDLVIGDKNALVIAARISGFGEDYDTRVSCTNCGESSTHSFNLEDHSHYSGADSELMERMEDSVQQSDVNKFIIPLPRSGVEVEVKILDGHDDRKMTIQNDRRQKMKLPESLATSQLKALIMAVNGDDDKSIVNSLVDAMPAQDARYLRKIYELLAPNVDLSFTFECPVCDSIEEDMEVPLTADFFWPRQ